MTKKLIWSLVLALTVSAAQAADGGGRTGNGKERNAGGGTAVGLVASIQDSNFPQLGGGEATGPLLRAESGGSGIGPMLDGPRAGAGSGGSGN